MTVCAPCCRANTAGEFDYDVGTLMWHDRSPETLGYDPAIAQKTCGKSACHPDQVAQFDTSMMGSISASGPCGLERYPRPEQLRPSFADTLPVGRAEGDRFSFQNTTKIIEEINHPLSRDQAVAKQKACNVCHTGCLDCTTTPTVERGSTP